MRGLATEIQQLSKDFRHSQKDFIMRMYRILFNLPMPYLFSTWAHVSKSGLKGQDEMGTQFFMNREEKVSLSEMLDRVN